MKKLILFVYFITTISLTNQSFAADNDYKATKDSIKKICNGVSNENYFIKGDSCTGAEKQVYYIKEVKVSKDDYDKQ